MFEYLLSNFGVFFTCFVGSGFFYFGLKIYLEIYQIKTKGISTYGDIIRYETVYEAAKDSDNTDTVFYFPIARFKDLENNFHEVKIEIASNRKPKFETPIKTKLFYLKQKTKYKVITEEKDTIKLSYFLMGLGFLICLISLLFLFI